jgi:hypothetical protein
MATKIQPFEELLNDAVKNFEETFGRKPEVAACAPGLIVFCFD